jgi:ribosomal protein S18 acetylase RimI-like enzyme
VNSQRAPILKAVEAFAAAHRYRRLLLNTAPFLLAAVRLYKRHGFRYTGEQPDLFGTKLLTMAKDVRRREVNVTHFAFASLCQIPNELLSVSWQTAK